MCTIDLDKYEVYVNWVSESEKFNFINKKINPNNCQIVEQKPFTPLRLVIRIFPINPYETVYEMSSSKCNSALIGSTKRKKLSMPKEKKIVYRPYKIEVGTSNNGEYIVKLKGNSNGFETTTYDMDYKKMLNDAQLQIKQTFDNADDIIPHVLEKI